MTLAIDAMGRHTKLIKKSATIALPLDHPVSTPEDWERVKHWYTFTEDRVNREKLLEQKKKWESGQLTKFRIPGAFDEPRQLLGEAEAESAAKRMRDAIENGRPDKPQETSLFADLPPLPEDEEEDDEDDR